MISLDVSADRHTAWYIKADLKTYGHYHLCTHREPVWDEGQRVIIHVPHGVKPTAEEVCGVLGLVPEELKRQEAISVRDLSASFEPHIIPLALAVARRSESPLAVALQSRLTLDTNETYGAKVTVVRGYKIPTLQSNRAALDELASYLRGELDDMFVLPLAHRRTLAPRQLPAWSVMVVELHCLADCGGTELVLDALTSKLVLKMLVADHLLKRGFRELASSRESPNGSSLPRNKSLGWLREQCSRSTHFIRIGVSRRVYGCEEQRQEFCKALAEFIVDFNRHHP